MLASTERYWSRYTGLRMLLRTGGRLLLVPEGWEQGTVAFLIDDEPSLRFEFSFPPSSSPAA